jgi:hypothetical protein
MDTRTAQYYIKKYNDDEDRRLLVSGRKSGAGRKATLTEVHSQFLIDYVDEHSTACYRTLEEISVKRLQGYRYQLSISA